MTGLICAGVGVLFGCLFWAWLEGYRGRKLVAAINESLALEEAAAYDEAQSALDDLYGWRPEHPARRRIRQANEIAEQPDELGVIDEAAYARRSARLRAAMDDPAAFMRLMREGSR